MGKKFASGSIKVCDIHIHNTHKKLNFFVNFPFRKSHLGKFYIASQNMSHSEEKELDIKRDLLSDVKLFILCVPAEFIPVV